MGSDREGANRSSTEGEGTEVPQPPQALKGEVWVYPLGWGMQAIFCKLYMHNSLSLVHAYFVTIVHIFGAYNITKLTR